VSSDVFRRTSLDDLSLPSVSFSSEAGEVLTLLPTFCGKTKSRSGFGVKPHIK